MEYIETSGVFLPLFKSKGWGGELWVVNTREYCGKILVFQSSRKCSWHYHKKKTETFHVLEGLVQILTGISNDLSMADSRFLSPGESLHIPVGIRHQIVAVEDSKVLEISTFHQEDDSYRLIKGD